MMIGRCWLMMFWVLLVVGPPPPVAHAYSKRSRTVIVVQEQYDRSITEFDPQGRLLQVEYGMQAALRGSPMVGVLMERQAKLYLAVHHRHHHNNNNKDTSSIPQVHRLDDHVFLLGAGLMGDTLFMAHFLRRWCQEHRIQHGEAPTVREVAEAAASLQHELTYTAGARPLGCVVVVAGVDPFSSKIWASSSSPSQPDPQKEDGLSLSSSLSSSIENNNNNDSEKGYDLGRYLQLFRTGPGGRLEDCLYCAVGKDENLLMKAMSPWYAQMTSSQKVDDDDWSMAQKLVSFLQFHSNGRNHKHHDKKTQGYDVWVIEPVFGRRGNMKATCHVNVGGCLPACLPELVQRAEC